MCRPMTGPTLATWLLAQYDAAERRVQTEEHYSPDDGGYYSCPATRLEPFGDLPFGEDACECGLAHRKAFALADLTAKRRIVELHGGNHECPSIEDNCGWVTDDQCDTIRLLALPYADREGYQSAWSPRDDDLATG